jgi:hypothetical protein
MLTRESRKRWRAKDATPVPNLHFWMIIIIAVLVALCLVIYPFVPSGKETLYVTTSAALVGFLTGKFSNGFGRSMVPDIRNVSALEADTGEFAVARFEQKGDDKPEPETPERESP